MRDSETTFLGNALEALDGAADEYAKGRYHNCANRAYYACFQAAVHALMMAGIKSHGASATWSHDGLQAAFSRELVIRRNVYPGEFRSILTYNQDMRIRADYEQRVVSEKQAARVLHRAQTFVAAVQQKAGNHA